MMSISTNKKHKSYKISRSQTGSSLKLFKIFTKIMYFEH